MRPGWMGWPDATTTVCRCEEVSLGAVDEAITELGSRSTRGPSSCMPGPAWGCARARSAVMRRPAWSRSAAGRGVTVADLQGIAGRPIAQPVTLGALAAAHRSATERRSAAPSPTGRPTRPAMSAGIPKGVPDA